jgi:hypothetical protein
MRRHAWLRRLSPALAAGWSFSRGIGTTYRAFPTGAAATQEGRRADRCRRLFEEHPARESFDQISPPSDNADDPFVSVTLNAGFSGLVLMNPGRIKVRAYRGDDEIRLGTLRIRLRSEWEDEQRAAQEMKEAAN